MVENREAGDRRTQTTRNAGGAVFGSDAGPASGPGYNEDGKVGPAIHAVDRVPPPAADSSSPAPNATRPASSPPAENPMTPMRRGIDMPFRGAAPDKPQRTVHVSARASRLDRNTANPLFARQTILQRERRDSETREKLCGIDGLRR